jgi:hypothetical protein
MGLGKTTFLVALGALAGTAFTFSCHHGSGASADAGAFKDAPGTADAGSNTGACCAGITKTVSAETDAAQLRTSTVAVAVPSATAIVSGPIVLTTVIAHDPNGGALLDLYLTSTTCADTANRSEIFALIPSTGGVAIYMSLPGRIWVPVGSTLCGTTSTSNPTAVPETVFYSGFVPY